MPTPTVGVVPMPGDRGTTLAVLAYHKIGTPPPDGWETWNYVSTTTFAEQLQTVLELGFQFIDLPTFRNAVRHTTPLPDRAAMLTFDDGYRSMLTVAQPILERFRLPGVLFVPTDFIGGHNDFDAGNEPREALCDWSELRRLQDLGVAVQSHSVSHRSFASLTMEQQRQELADSKARLEEGLGTPVDLFAFPFGERGPHDETDALLADLGYMGAMLYKGGPLQVPVDHPFRMTRVAVGPDTNLRRHLGANG